MFEFIKHIFTAWGKDLTIATIVSLHFLHSDSKESFSLNSFFIWAFFMSKDFSSFLCSFNLPHEIDVVHGGSIHLCFMWFDSWQRPQVTATLSVALALLDRTESTSDLSFWYSISLSHISTRSLDKCFSIGDWYSYELIDELVPIGVVTFDISDGKSCLGRRFIDMELEPDSESEIMIGLSTFTDVDDGIFIWSKLKSSLCPIKCLVCGLLNFDTSWIRSLHTPIGISGTSENVK